MKPLLKRIEVNYRGIFQKTLAKRICSDIVYVAHRAGKVGFSNGRYSDSPERNGVPCKYFAFVSNMSEEDLEAICGAKLDIDEADVSVVVDDTMVKGVEPWGWHGIRPINEKVKEGGTLLVISRKDGEDLMKFVGRKPYSHKIATLEGEASFSGLWVYKDDLTDVRVLGAIAAIDPDIIDLPHLEEYIREKYKEERKTNAVRDAYSSVRVREVTPQEGIIWPHKIPELPKWHEFEEGIVVPAVKRGYQQGPKGQSRNTVYVRGTTKSMRPVVRFDLCVKCTLCWAECPDEVFDPTPDGLYDVDYEYCTGCGKCAEVCPVNECIVMVDELRFNDNKSPWEAYGKDPHEYVKWAEEKKGKERVSFQFVTGRGVEKTSLESPAPSKVKS